MQATIRESTISWTFADNIFHVIKSYSEYFPHSYFWYFDPINTTHSIQPSQLVSLLEQFYFQKPRLTEKANILHDFFVV